MFPKIGGSFPPKWINFIMVPNPINKWMIWGVPKFVFSERFSFFQPLNSTRHAPADAPPLAPGQPGDAMEVPWNPNVPWSKVAFFWGWETSHLKNDRNPYFIGI